jgi:hypothetical protein
MISYLISNLILLIHVILVLYIIVTPFTNFPLNNLLHCTLIVCILIHWLANDNTCCLTLLEKYFRKNCNSKDLFFQRLVGPVYQPRHDKFIIYGMILLAIWSGYRSQPLKTYNELKSVFSL